MTLSYLINFNFRDDPLRSGKLRTKYIPHLHNVFRPYPTEDVFFALEDNRDTLTIEAQSVIFSERNSAILAHAGK